MLLRTLYWKRTHPSQHSGSDSQKGSRNWFFLSPFCITLPRAPPWSINLSPAPEALLGSPWLIIPQTLYFSSWTESQTLFPSPPCRQPRLVTTLWPVGCQQKWHALEPAHKSSFTIIAFFHQQSSGWMSPEGDLGSYVLKMTKLWPTWIPDQSLHEQQMKFCIRPLRHGGLSK